MKINKCSCGFEAVLKNLELEEDDEGRYTVDVYIVECNNCGLYTRPEFTEEDAIISWNNKEELLQDD